MDRGAAAVWHFACEFEPLGERIAFGENVVAAFGDREVCGLEHHRGEEQFEHDGRHDAGEVCADDCAGNRRALEDHRDFQIGPSVAHECDAGAGAGRDDGYQARADCNLHRHVREDDQRGHDENAAAEARDRADKSGADRKREQVDQDFKQAKAPDS